MKRHMFFDSLQNSENITLPNMVRSLPKTVRFPNQGNALSLDQIYQGTTKKNVNDIDMEVWNNFEEYLKKSYRKSSVRCRLLYAKQYYRVVLEENAQSLLVLPYNKRSQVMKSLSVLSKFMGCYDNWKNIKDRYQLKWSNENSVETFKKIINEGNSFDNLLEWLKTTSSQISEAHRNILFYCSLTGLRPDEACQSIKLVKENITSYQDKDKMILKHFEFPEINRYYKGIIMQ